MLVAWRRKTAQATSLSACPKTPWIEIVRENDIPSAVSVRQRLRIQVAPDDNGRLSRPQW
jgi:hypothetical protein